MGYLLAVISASQYGLTGYNSVGRAGEAYSGAN